MKRSRVPRWGKTSKRLFAVLAFFVVALASIGLWTYTSPAMIAHVSGERDMCHSFCTNFCSSRTGKTVGHACNDQCTSACANLSQHYASIRLDNRDHASNLNLAQLHKPTPITPSPIHVSSTPTVPTLATAAPSSSLTPSSQITGTTGAGAPFPEAPLCPSHDDIRWHGLWDGTRGCHYNHTHNDEPVIGNSVFGSAGSLWGGQTISYPWMTLNENSFKGHQGYKYYVNLSPQPADAQEGYEYIKPDPHFVSAFRVQYHDAGGNAHMVKRFHSYYLEAQIKSRDGGTVGTIKTGGHADFGCLHQTYKSRFLPLPGIDPINSIGASQCGNGQSIHSDPYRAPGKTLQEVTGIANSRDNMWIWTAHNQYGFNRLGFFFFRTLDSWGAIDPADPYTEHFICPTFDCKFNNSEHHVFNVYLMIPASLDTDRDGIVNYSGYTDVQGNIVDICSAPSPTCVPLQIVNAPVGTAIWSRNTSGIRPAGDPIRDHDIYFGGKPSGWIQFL